MVVTFRCVGGVVFTQSSGHNTACCEILSTQRHDAQMFVMMRTPRNTVRKTIRSAVTAGLPSNHMKRLRNARQEKRTLTSSVYLRHWL